MERTHTDLAKNDSGVMQKQSIQQKTDLQNEANPLPLNPAPLHCRFAGPPTVFGSGHMTGQVIHHPVCPGLLLALKRLTIWKALLSQGNPLTQKISMVDHLWANGIRHKQRPGKTSLGKFVLLLCLLYLQVNMCKLSGRSGY